VCAVVFARELNTQEVFVKTDLDSVERIKEMSSLLED
jgi:hypothetical protein